MFQSLSYGKCEGDELYVACLGSLDKYEASIYLVWSILINTKRLFILFGHS